MLMGTECRLVRHLFMSMRRMRNWISKETERKNGKEQIIRTEYSDIMQKSYIDYAMSVIVARALPDVRDGLKPVQRRTLYDMYELGIRYDRPYRKCARIVGDTMGKYHPHGDSSIYEALVVMAQEFKKGLPLVDSHGNFGSIEETEPQRCDTPRHASEDHRRFSWGSG